VKSQLKHQFQLQVLQMGSSLPELEMFLSLKHSEMTRWSHLLSSLPAVPVVLPDPLLGTEFCALYELRQRVSEALSSLTSQGCVLLAMIERARVVCTSASSLEIRYTDLFSGPIKRDPTAPTAELEFVDLKDLIALLGNEISKWICQTIFKLSQGIGNGEDANTLSVSDFHCGFMIGNESLYRLAVTATHSSNVRYRSSLPSPPLGPLPFVNFSLRSALQFLKRNQFNSDATILYGVLAGESSQKKEFTSEFILRKFVLVLQGKEKAAETAKGTAVATDRKKRKRGREKEKEQKQDEEEEEKGEGNEEGSFRSRYLMAVSELQRLGYLRITSTGHQLKKLMANWGGGR
jgi:hypothetical protein